jgi:hypothetical protein
VTIKELRKGHTTWASHFVGQAGVVEGKSALYIGAYEVRFSAEQRDYMATFYPDELDVEAGDHPPAGLVNRETGLPPTAGEWQMIKAHAARILSNPYASPEAAAWALDICPDGIAVPFERAMDKMERRIRL